MITDYPSMSAPLESARGFLGVPRLDFGNQDAIYKASGNQADTSRTKVTRLADTVNRPYRIESMVTTC